MNTKACATLDKLASDLSLTTMTRPFTILVHELHRDVVGGVDHEVGDEDVEEVGRDVGAGDGPVEDQEEIDPVD